MLYKEKYRPYYHFSPRSGWLNDPNGLVYFQGEYHLFYQYHPYDIVWGPMHWGHAISKDLIHWEHQPIALYPDEHGFIYSGCAVVDWNDTSGLFDGEAGLVAIFTHACTEELKGKECQMQSLAYSRDRGRTWTKYANNPVLVSESELDFRDPKVFWHVESERWIMILAVGNKVQIFSSKNLIDWNFESEFGENEGSHDGVWECPDLIRLSVDDSGESKWLMIISIGDSPRQPEGSRTQYFIGTFDGSRFVNDHSPPTVLWLDHGRDNYAGVTWSDTDGERKIYIGWMNNWKYANRIPAEGFRGNMTIPRELSLTRTTEGIRVIQKPVEQMKSLRQEERCWMKQELADNRNVTIESTSVAKEIVVDFRAKNSKQFGLVFTNENDDLLRIGYDRETCKLFIDRSESGVRDFHKEFACRHDARLELEDDLLSLQVFLDKTSVEVFASGGKIVMTDLVFPTQPYDRIQFFTIGGSVNIENLSVYRLERLWKPGGDEEARVVQWKFDEGKGKVTVDTVSGMHDPIHFALSKGRFQAPKNPEWRSGISGNALLFDGYSTYIRRPSSQVCAISKGLTVTAWVAPRTYNYGDENRLAAIVNQHDREAKQGYIVGMSRHGYWSLGLGFGDEWVELRSKHPIPNRQWSFLAATYHAETGEMRLYCNGKLDSEKRLAVPREIIPCKTDLLVGRNNQSVVLADTFYLNMFDGLMDEVTVYAEAKTETQLRELFHKDLVTHNGVIPSVTEKELLDSWELWRNDKHHPQYHVCPPGHWMNEPHAPIYFKGKYHLFYQYNPKGPFWHQIHWGHWVSEDLINWEDVAPALTPEEGSLDPDGIWSGSASLNQDGVPVLFYTAANENHSPNQSVALATSTFQEDQDLRLQRWRKHPEYLVTQKKDQGIFGEFRDPFVWRDEERWYMIVGSGLEGQGGTAFLYTSVNLYDWQDHGPLYVSNYERYPFLGTVWELPVLLPVRNKKQGVEKHIFLISPWGAGADVEVYYWIGHFDKESLRFIPDHEDPQLIDLGDFHFTGPSGMVDPRTGRTILFTIAQGERTPEIDYDSGWAHTGGLPVSLSLRDDGKLGVEPIEEIMRLRGKKLLEVADLDYETVNGKLRSVRGDMLEIQVEFSTVSANRYGLVVRKTEHGEEETLLTYDEDRQWFEVNREKSTKSKKERTRGIQGGHLDLEGEHLCLRVFIDRSLIEAYCNGLKSLTTRVYPLGDDADGIRIHADGELRIVRMEVWEMKPASRVNGCKGKEERTCTM